MKPCLRTLLIVLVLSSGPGFSFAQLTLTKAQLEDFSNQAKRQVLLIFDNVAELGSNTLSASIKEKAISNVSKSFTGNGSA